MGNMAKLKFSNENGQYHMSFEHWKAKNLVRLAVAYVENQEKTKDYHMSFNEYCAKVYRDANTD